MLYRFLIILMFAMQTYTSCGQELKPNNPIELGLVNWNRNYEEALKKANATGKPLFILFQEVPGCSNCTRFGREILSNPIIKDIIESEFVPLCIYNNKTGEDAKVLTKFREPSWNNPVCRIINASEKDLVDRMWRFHPLEIFQGIDQALQETGRKPPKYFELALSEVEAYYTDNIATAYFSMFCFWSGELKLGPIGGVVKTTAGFMDGREVVELQYNPNVLSYEDLVKKAMAVECAHRAYTLNDYQNKIATKILGGNRVGMAKSFRQDSEVKYYLSKSDFKSIPMTARQKIYVNHAIAYGNNPMEFLSPSQISVYKNQVRNRKMNKSYIKSDDLVGDWEAIISRD